MNTRSVNSRNKGGSKVSEEFILKKENLVLTQLSPQQQAFVDKMSETTNMHTFVHQPSYNFQKQFDETMALVSTPAERAKPITDRLDKQIEILGNQLQQAETTNAELQAKLEKANFELKQLNDKSSSQNLYIKELKADLKEEMERRIKAEDTISPKDWKMAIISLVIGFITGVGGGIILHMIVGG